MFTFIESSVFSKYIYDYLSEDEYIKLQNELAAQPNKGDIIQSSGGIRKIRFAAKGKGKRGGVRVIYYLQNQKQEIWLLTIYAKNEAENIPTNILKKLKEKFEDI